MAINKKRDFKRLSLCIQDFLKRLPSNENTGFLRDTLYLSLLELHKYYIKEKERVNLQQTNEAGKLAIVHKHACNDVEFDKFDERWGECDDGGKFIKIVEGSVENIQSQILSDNHDLLGRTFLMHAIHGEQQEMVKFILSLNFNVNHQAQNGATALHLACQHPNSQVVALLLKNKASVSIRDHKLRSALHWAAKCQSSDIVKLLLQNGADINEKDCDGMTPAMWACYFNKPSNLQILRNALERIDPRSDAILDEQDNIGRTVLHWAAMSGDQDNNVSCLKDLLTLGNVCEIKDKSGRTVLHTAAMQGSVPASKLILSSCGKDILDVKDNQDQTALHLATVCGHGEMVDLLLQQGANGSVCNKNGRTALQEAEIGHYHYCLLVFAAFEQIKEKREARPPLVRSQNNVEKKNNDTKRYESWVIPSTSLNESHDIPSDIAKGLTSQQLVDVSEVKGFEIEEEELEDRVIGNVSQPEKPVVTKEKLLPSENKPVTKTHKPEKPVVAKAKLVPSENEPATNTIKPASSSDKPVGKPVVTIDGKASLAGRSNKGTLLQRSDRVEESKDMKVEESNVDKNETTKEGTSQQDEDLEGYSSQYLQQNGSASESEDESEISEISEIIEISSIESMEDEDIKNEKETSKASDPEAEKGKKERTSSGPTKQTKGSHGPIKPLPQPSFPAKLDPIPLLHPNRKLPQSSDIVTSHNIQSRGIVAPLQPPVQKEQPGLSLLSRDKLQYPSAGTNYGARGSDHGPLAQAHSKELLNSVFKENGSNTVEQQKTPEIQRRSMQPTKLSRPTVRH